MTIQFTVSAPGKVILNGEHSVVYNKPALAGVVGLRNYITLTENSDAVIKINLDVFADAEINFTLSAINEFLNDVDAKFDMANFLDNSEKSHNSFLEDVKKFVQSNVSVTAGNGNLEKTLCAIIYLLAAIESSVESKPQLKLGLTLDFKSQITIGSGLGSSASFAVCLAAAFCTYAMARTTSKFIRLNRSVSAKEKLAFLNKVSSWAFLSERIMHGNPSGLDNTICTFGNVVQFTKTPQVISNVALKMKMNILLVNSGVSRNTLHVVENVKKLRGQHEQLIDLILNAMGVLVNDVVSILENDQPDAETQNYEQLKQLFTINNNLLRAIGVSHAKLEEIFAISERNGFGCKLTGAGAGGYAIVLLPPNYLEQTNYERLCSEFTERKFEWNVTTIGGDGLKVSQEN